MNRSNRALSKNSNRPPPLIPAAAPLHDPVDRGRRRSFEHAQFSFFLLGHCTHAPGPFSRCLFLSASSQHQTRSFLPRNHRPGVRNNHPRRRQPAAGYIQPGLATCTYPGLLTTRAKQARAGVCSRGRIFFLLGNCPSGGGGIGVIPRVRTSLDVDCGRHPRPCLTPPTKPPHHQTNCLTRPRHHPTPHPGHPPT